MKSLILFVVAFPKQTKHNTHPDYITIITFFTRNLPPKQSKNTNHSAKSFSFSPVFDISNEVVSTLHTAHITHHITELNRCDWSRTSNW